MQSKGSWSYPFYVNLLLEGMFEKKWSGLDSTSISKQSIAMQLVL